MTNRKRFANWRDKAEDDATPPAPADAPATAPTATTQADLLGELTERVQAPTGTASDDVLADIAQARGDVPTSTATDDAQGTPRRRGGWPKGKSRAHEPRYAGEGSTAPPKDGAPRTRGGARRLTRDELQAENEALRGELAARHPDAVKEATDALEGTFAVLASMATGGRFRSLTPTDQEAKQLATAWAPVLAPHIPRVAERLPVLMALAVTAKIMWPKWQAFQNDEQRAALDATPADANGAIITTANGGGEP